MDAPWRVVQRVVATTGLVAAASPVAGAQEAAPSLATAAVPLIFRGVTVIDVRDGARQLDQVVTVVDRRIQTIAPAKGARVPKGARVVDARGKYLIPGLWDLHVHPQGYVDIAFPLFLANGITGVRDAGSSVPLATLTQWKREIVQGTRIGPRLLVSGPAIDEAPDSQTTITRDTGLASHYIEVPRALAGYAVDSLHAAGADFIKTYGMSREMYFAIAAEARRLGIPFGGHLPLRAAATGRAPARAGVDGREASDSGARFLDHITWLAGDPCGDQRTDSLDATRCAAAAEQFRRNNTWVTISPLLDLGIDSLAGQPRPALDAYMMSYVRRFMPRAFQEQDYAKAVRNADSLAAADPRAAAAAFRVPTATAGWAVRASGPAPFIARWHAARMPIVVGTDINLIPFWIYRDITAGVVMPITLVGFVLSGPMTPLEALQTATLNPALALGATDSLGTVEAGKLADLILLDADPLADIWNTTKIRGVVADGRYYDRPALDGLLAGAERAAHR